MFKSGDRVICIDDSGQQEFAYDDRVKFIIKGKTYIVKEGFGEGVRLVGIDTSNGYIFRTWKSSRFRLSKRRVMPIKSGGNIL